MFTVGLTVRTETSAAGPTFGKESLLSNNNLIAGRGVGTFKSLSHLKYRCKEEVGVEKLKLQFVA